ncbi:hypothetical protein OIK40_12270 [Erythrobacter sp. sf7]|uniref:Uncharacterized protein n=1 Tax=Erythrobacter fulvus TaxID=2987523 RepID=A0ABT5JRN0_9SPHN|nr:hypothetical protein [Erythrobacter fulvus]
MTIVGAVVMVGPKDGGGMLSRLATTSAPQQDVASEAPKPVRKKPEQIVEPLDPASGWGNPSAPVFDDYDAAPEEEEEAADTVTEPEPVSNPRYEPARRGPYVARPSGPIGLPVVADNPGIVEPGEDDAAERAALRRPPVPPSL